MARTAAATRRPADPRYAIRLGLPLSPLTDLYYHLMSGPWWRLIGLLVVAYLVVNLGFAVAYLMLPGGIASAEPGSFVDAFAFSVQTLSTIGYGSFSPTSPAVHAVVTAEAIVGLVGTAIATGLVFAKYARPRAKVMFTNDVLIRPRNGRPTLVFRVGNARGNEIIEASLNVVVLLPERTQEGEMMRRLLDLPLVRATSPMFAMTWTVLHEIDESSPLFGLDEAALDEARARVIVSLTGIDGTFSQMVHARRIYEHDEIRWNRRFVDIVDFTDDGRLRIDYQRFHDTEPLPEPSSYV